MQALHRVAETAVNARSEVREAYSAYRTAYDTAKHYRDEIVPLRKRIAEENLLRYNGMLISVFELLADAREQVASRQRLRSRRCATSGSRRPTCRRRSTARLDGAGGRGAEGVRRMRRVRRARRALRTTGDVPHDDTPTIPRRVGAALLGAALVSRAQAASLPEAPVQNKRGDAAAARAAERAALQPGRDAERLDAALAHEGRLEGVPPHRRAGGARVRARHDGATCGATTASRRARRSSASRATRCASSSPTSCPSTRRSTGTASCCRTAWTASAGSTQPQIPVGQDLRLRVRR